MKVFGRQAKAIVGTVLLGLLAGCGSASSNDQGVSFLATGWYPSDATTITGRGLTGIAFPIGGSGGAGDLELGGFDGIVASIGLQNNLAGQGIRVERVFLSYFIFGASAQPPSTSASLSSVLGPTIRPTPATSLPPGFTGSGTSSVSQILAVPASIRSWILFNRAQLPEPPFEMDITAYATGVTTSGDRLDTNPITLTATVTTDVVIAPSAPSGSGLNAPGVIEEVDGVPVAGVEEGSGF